MKKVLRKFWCVLISVLTVCSTYVLAEGEGGKAYRLIISNNGNGISSYAFADRYELSLADVSISFDYYLCNADSSATLVNLSDYKTIKQLSQGWNSISFSSGAFSGGFCPGIRLNNAISEESTEIYFKNISITVNGAEVFKENAPQYSKENCLFEKLNESELPSADGYLIDFNGTLPEAFYCISYDTWKEAKGKPVEVSFDYYIDNASDGELFVENIAGGGGFIDNKNGTKFLKSGENSFSYKIESYAGDGFCVGIKGADQNKATNAKIYIRNIVITVNGKNYFDISATQWYSKNPLPEISPIRSSDIPFKPGENGETVAYSMDFSDSGAGAYYCISNDTWKEAKGKPVEISFDYYIENANSGELFVENIAGGGGFIDNSSGSKLLKNGKSRFSCITDSFERDGFCAAIRVLDVRKPSNANVYIWNVVILVNGTNYFNKNAVQYYKGSLPAFETLNYSDISIKSAEYSRERPYEGNAAYLPYEDGAFTSPYDTAAEELREKILNMSDSAVSTSRVYYVSYRGNDGNNGLSPATAWKTTSNLNNISSYSTVLFERGGVYRGAFNLKSNVSYGAYGSGPKPCIYGSPRNYASEGLWEKYADNIWKLSIEGSEDVGSIIFDNGAKSATRVIKSSSLSLNGKLEYLTSDYMYLYQDGAVYLRLGSGNPGKIHYDIEITDRALAPAVLIGGYRLSNVAVENLCLKYGNFGISTSGRVSNVTVRGCEIGYIGGCLMADGIVRWGNGIEIWGPCNDILIENCWVYQCYDAGITNQCNEDNWVMKNVYFTENLVELCQYAIESFNGVGQTENQIYNKNILRFSGYQVYDPKVRHGSDSSYTSLINVPWEDKQYTNFVIEDNILDTSYGYIIKGQNFNQPGGIICKNNTYFQQTGLKTYFYDKDNYEICPSVAKLEDGTLYTALSQYEIEHGAEAIDLSPAAADYSLNKDSAADKLMFSGSSGNPAYLLTKQFVSENALNISLDYYYSGKSGDIALINLANSEIIAELENGKNSLNAEYGSSGESICIGVIAKDAAAAVDESLYLSNVNISSAGTELFDKNTVQPFKNAPAHIEIYADEIPGFSKISSDMYLLDFNGVSANAYYTLTNDPPATGKNVKISFSYYLSGAENREISAFNIAGGTLSDEISGNCYLRNGRNRFFCEFTEKINNKTFCLGLATAAENSKSKLYIWDINITVDGKSIFNPTAKQWCNRELIPKLSKLTAGMIPYSADVNNNGVVDIIDLVRLKRHLSNNKTAVETVNADSDINGKINSSDLAVTRKILLGIYY